MPRHPPRSLAAAVPPPPGTARRSPCAHSTTTRRHPAIQFTCGVWTSPVRGHQNGGGAMAARDEGDAQMSESTPNSHDQHGIGRPGLPVRRPTRLRGCEPGLHRHDRAGRDPRRRGQRGLRHRLVRVPQRGGFAHGASEPLAAVVARAAARPVRGRRGHLPGAQLRPVEHHVRRGRHGRDRDRPADLDRDGRGGARAVPGAPRRAPGGRRDLHALAHRPLRRRQGRRLAGGRRRRRAGDRPRGIPRARDLRERLRRHGDGPPRRVHVRRGPPARRAGQRGRRTRAVHVGRHGDAHRADRVHHAHRPGAHDRRRAHRLPDGARNRGARPRCTSTSPTAGRCAWPRTRRTPCTTCSRSAAPWCATRTPGPGT